jgi:chromosome segregation ATPase
VVLKANDRVDQLFTNQVQPLFTKFDRNVNTFHIDVSKLTQEVSTVATASTSMANASTSMAKAASDMSTSATTLQSSVQQIDTHLVSLNQTEGDMVTKIEKAQQKVADEVKIAATAMNTAAGTVSGAANKMEQAAQKVENAGNALSTVNIQNARQLSNDVTTLTVKARETALELQRTVDAIRRLSGQSVPRRTRILGIFPRP